MTMKSYLDQLKAQAEAANLRSDEAKSKPHCADSRILCDTILVDQIEYLMRSLSPAQRNRPWLMDELVSRLQGRYSARPHPMNVGTALRQLGWTQKRDWTRDGGGRRVWHPSQE
jgi:hypothetical protein